jgi:hypothetical protein
VNGCATTLVLRAEVDDFAKGQGVAFTAHGVAVPIDVAKGWLDPEAKAILVLMSKTRGIVAYSDKQRLFTEQQRLAMFARDKGCSYWGCDSTFSWTQAHHVTDYKITRRTSVDDGALACTANHATFERMPGFKGSSQHLIMEGVVGDGEIEQTGAAEVGVVGCSDDPARGSSPVLAGDRRRHAYRWCIGSGRCVAGGWSAVVCGRWRRGAAEFDRALGPISVFRRARGDCDLVRPTGRGA